MKNEKIIFESENIYYIQVHELLINLEWIRGEVYDRN